MKFRIQNRGVASGLAASALLAAHQNQTGSAELQRFVDANGIQAFDFHRITANPPSDETDEDVSTFVVVLPHEPDWDETSQSRFEELVEKIALEVELNPEDHLEYRALKALRQRTHSSRSYDEIVADHELHKKVTEAVNSLKILIEYATSTFPSEAQTNRS